MPSSPATFEHFEVARHADGSLHELGRGAMGVTYKAFDTRLGSYVALKVIDADAIQSEVGRVRFEREAKAAAHLNHPNVASIFHRGQGGGTYFYAMEFIEGETFDAFVKRRGPLSVRFDSPPPLGADLAAQPLESWPPSQLEIATLAGALTGGHPAQALGALTYELLAGHPPEAEYRPVAGVNARGNAVLRQVLEATDAFGTAVRFTEAFRLSLAGELHVPKSSAAVVVAETDAWKSDTREYPVGGSLLARPVGRRRGFLVRRAPVLILLLLGLAAGGWWYVKGPGGVFIPQSLEQVTTVLHASAPSPTPTPTGPWLAPEGATTIRAVRRYAPPPFFPPAAKAARQHGTVLLDVGVDAAGNVTGSTVMRSSGFPLLDEAAKQALGVWKFDPARTNEVAVPSRTLQSIEFNPPPAGMPPEPPGR